MAVRRSTSVVVISALTAGLTVGGLLLASTAASVASTSADVTQGLCQVAGAHRAKDVADVAVNAHAAAVAGVSATQWQRLAQDPTLRVTACGDPYFVDQHEVVQRSVAPSTTPTDVNGTATPPYPTANTFKLNSRPAAKHTLYLDFLGGTVTGTQWNSAIGQSTINVAPFSNDSTISRTWSTSDLGAIQHVWQVAAEDYAPFDVNVTTQCPGAMRSDGTCDADTTGAISRSSGADLVYGSIIRITPQQSNPAVWVSSNGCGTQCDGLSWLNVASTSGVGLTKQPSWMFPSIGDYTPNMIGSVVSHEIGHQLGLSHDGTNAQGAGSYYWGTAQWSPIMGGAFSIDNTWSKGEYADANNHEDDLGIIRTKWGSNPSAIGHTTATATALYPGTKKQSVLTSTPDFYEIPAGSFALAATPTTYAPNLDIRMIIRDKSGTVVQDVNPAAGNASCGSPAFLCGLAARWTGSLAAAGAPYRVELLPTGSTYYPVYGSLGNYTITLAPTAFSTYVYDVPPAQLNTAYSQQPVFAAGGTKPYAWTSTTLPAGLRINANSGLITGTPTAATAGMSVTVTATDATGAVSSKTVTVRVNSAPLVATTTSIPAFTAYAPFTFTKLSAKGGSGGYRYSLVQNSQTVSGITVSANGAVTGNVPMNNIDQVTDRVLEYRIVDSSGHAATGSAKLTINPGAIGFRCLGTTTVEAGTCASHDVNAAYGAAHVGHGYGPVIIKVARGWSAISGSKGGDKFTFAGGTVPPGMTLGYLNAYLGKQYAVLSGTPSKAGTYTFKVTATDQHNHAVTTYLTMKVS